MADRVVILTGLTHGKAEHVAFFLAGMLSGALQHHSGRDGWSVSVRADEERTAREALRKAGLGR